MSRNRSAPFTRQMKKTHTILMPQMLEYHSALLKAAFEGSGYHFDVMDGSVNLKDKALRYINNDCCYPGILIIGQILDVLEEGRYPVDRVRRELEQELMGRVRSHKGKRRAAYRRILKKLHMLYPKVNIQTIEYGYDSGDTLRESRIRMGLGEFREGKIGKYRSNDLLD